MSAKQARFVVGPLAAFLLISANHLSIASERQSITLGNGQTYEVETVNGLPVRFKNRSLVVRDVGITARFSVDDTDSPPFVWILVGDLRSRGNYTVKISTPLDSAALAETMISGPGQIRVPFFPMAEFPTIWEGIDGPGVHYFPFLFVFEGQRSEQTFKFLQWAQVDESTWGEMKSLVERASQQLRAPSEVD